jgi:hypothetical protein
MGVGLVTSFLQEHILYIYMRRKRFYLEEDESTPAKRSIVMPSDLWGQRFIKSSGMKLGFSWGKS